MIQKRQLIIGLFLLQSFPGFAQEYRGFSDNLVRKLNTAANEVYLSVDEKEVVLMINLIRNNGQLFWDSIGFPYILEREIEQNKYVQSLKSDLKHVMNLQPLFPDKSLFEAAKRHAIASGKQGSLGHESSAGTLRQRMNPFKGTFSYVSENCDYGSNTAIDILMNLLIDDGIPDVGHRVNILEPRINVVGVSIQPHRNYTHNCVQVFGELLRK